MQTTPVNTALLGTQAGLRQQKLKETCQDFESLLVGTMLRAMRGSSQESDPLVEKNLGEQIFTDMLDSEYAKLASRTSRFGLADLLYRQLSNDTQQAQGTEGTLRDLQRESIRSSVPVENYQTPAPISTLPQPDAVRRVAQYNSLINSASRQSNVDANLLRGMILQESQGRPQAVSSAGAKGLMQLMDTTAAEVGVADSFDPAQNILGGARYLSSMLKRFAGNVEQALASYNAGPGAVEAHKGIPPYPETQTYVRNVLAFRQYFSNLYGG